MGAAGSSSSAPSAPFREQGETFVYQAEESCCPEYANENIRQRTRTDTFDVGEEPRSQGPSPYATFRGEEWWSQRPSAPSLSNLRPHPRETLLTYAAQMTGWQTAEGRSPSQHHQETIELSKVISQLAMANQQLASAHTATLAHFEALYLELQKEKESRRPAVPIRPATLDEALKKRLTIERQEDEEDWRRMEDRIDRLEYLLSDHSNACEYGPRNSREEEDRKLRSRIQRLETMVKSRGLDRERQRLDVCDSIGDQDTECEQMNEFSDRLSSIHVPEIETYEFKTQISTDDEVRAKIIPRISVTRDEEEVRDSGRKCNDETDRSVANLHLEKDSETTECGKESREEQSLDGKEVSRLSGELERLMAERLELQSENARLAKELADQKAIVRKLAKDYEETKARYEEVEFSLQERGEEYDKLMAKFGVATKETERLLKEIDAFNELKDTAEAKISSLEQDLQKSLSENEQIKNIESQKTSKLKAQLSEEVSDKKKQIQALENAMDEIERLKETIKTERKSGDDDGPKEDIELMQGLTLNSDAIESIDDPQESPPADRATNIEEFKKELTLKREARQRAIAAVSSEMERLRRELDAEKEAHSETSRVLELLRSAQNGTQSQPSVTSESSKKFEAKDQKQEEQDLAKQRIEAQRLTSVLKVSDELRNDIRIQMDKVDDLRYQLETESDLHRFRIRSLSDVANRAREAVYVRERRTSDLKDHLAQILVRFGDRSFLELKDDVGLECERQLENMNCLKSLYNERLKVLNELKDAAVRELADTRLRLDHSVKKCDSLEEDLKKADEKIDAQDTEITNLESQLGLTKADCRDLQNQMSLINGLFTQMLLGATSADMDLDRLTQLLQENHDLICDMAREEGTEAAALPKLLLDLIEQVEGNKGSQKRVDGETGTEGETEKKEEDLQQEDIAHNLPKVWRVLLELLSCHAEGTPTASAASSSDPNICYKSVDTPAGPRLVISVSKTYIRLKELILEKKHLEKEMNRMKQLNTHLESKLGEQEKKLSTVSAELSKTWTIVDRMQAQHHQLHTHEKILRYELQQKRKMLQELKQELEYCREKWESARQKNTNTELEWRSLRREFAARKALAAHDSFNNSAESGFSDERGDDTDEEDNAVEGRIRLGPRRRPRKESPRAPSPDTESEQPTDTELSEPKTGSSATLEQRTPTPETEAELDEAEVMDTSRNAESTKEISSIPESPEESLNPLDEALTNVIQNLIGIDDSITLTSESFTTSNNEDVAERVAKENSISIDLQTVEPKIEPWTDRFYPEHPKIDNDENTKEDSTSNAQQQEDHQSISTKDPQDATKPDGEETKNEESPTISVSQVSSVTSVISIINAQPVFSIGPFLSSESPSIVKNVQFSEPLVVGPSNRFFAPVFGTSLCEGQFSSSFESPTSGADSKDAELEEKRDTKSTESVINSDNVSVDPSSSLDTVKEFCAVGKNAGFSSSVTEAVPVSSSFKIERVPISESLVEERVPVSDSSIVERVPVSDSSVIERVPVSNSFAIERVPIPKSLTEERVLNTDSSTTERVPVSDSSTVEKVPVSNSSTDEKVPVTNSFAIERVPIPKSLTEEGVLNTDSSTTERVPVSDSSTVEKVPVSNSSTNEKVPVSNSFAIERVPIPKSFTEERVPNSDSSTAERIPVSNSSATEKVSAFDSSTVEKVSDFDSSTVETVPVSNSFAIERVPLPKSLAEERVPNSDSSAAERTQVPNSSTIEKVPVSDSSTPISKSSTRSTVESTPSNSLIETGKPETNSSEANNSSKEEEKKVSSAKSRTPDEVLAAREDRLKRLEEQAKWLMNKMNATSRRGSALSSRLEELHEVYGEPPVPPPMPDVLPSRRLRTNSSDLPRQVPESSTMEGAKNIEKPISDGDSNESSSNNAS